MHRRGAIATLWAGLLAGLLTQAGMAADGPTNNASKLTGPEGLAAELVGLADAQLGERMDRERKRYQDTYEACLTEIVRRGGKSWEAFLETRLKQILDRWDRAPATPQEQNDLGRLENLQVLTALRRIQKKPDPLAITIAQRPEPGSVWPELPVLKVTLANADAGRCPIRIFVGDFAFGPTQWSRWRVNVRMSDGSLARVRPYGAGSTGHFRRLDFGESVEVPLDMARYVGPLEPGEYVFWVQYHDVLPLNGDRHDTGLILCESEPARLQVTPRVIQVGDAGRGAASDLAALDETGTVKIFRGDYAEDSYDFLPPDSPPGRLLLTGWPAVPALVRALEAPDLVPRKRAWVLAVLYSITGLADPRRPGVLPDCEDKWVQGHWARANAGTGWAIGSGEGRQAGEIQTNRQTEFAGRWLTWQQRKCFVARDGPDEADAAKAGPREGTSP